MLGDMSHTERIRFLRCRTLAIWKRNSGGRLEQGAPPSGVDDSTRMARRLGQKAYIRQLPPGGCSSASGSSTVEILPCCN